MKPTKFLLALIISISSSIIACNNKKPEGASPGINDTTSTNPTKNAMDYQPDQSQQIPSPDSSNTIGTDTILKDSIKH